MDKNKIRDKSYYFDDENFIAELENTLMNTNYIEVVDVDTEEKQEITDNFSVDNVMEWSKHETDNLIKPKYIIHAKNKDIHGDLMDWTYFVFLFTKPIKLISGKDERIEWVKKGKAKELAKWWLPYFRKLSKDNHNSTTLVLTVNKMDWNRKNKHVDKDHVFIGNFEELDWYLDQANKN